MVLKRFLSISLLVFYLFLLPKALYAAGGDITVLPQTGNYSKGQEFTATIKVNGGGIEFNAAKAYVAVSSNISVQGLNLGDCNFAFVTTPTSASLSFAGVILGGAIDTCTVYTLNLKADGGGPGYILVSDGSIKSYQGALEILSSVHGSNWNVAGPAISYQVTPTQAPLTLDGGVKTYTLTFTLPAIPNVSASSVKVVLDPTSEGQSVTPTSLASDDKTLVATFENVNQGVHTISVFNDKEEVSKQVVNIQGPNRNIVLGSASKPVSGPNIIALMFIAAIIAVLAIAAIFVFIVWTKRRKSQIP